MGQCDWISGKMSVMASSRHGAHQKVELKRMLLMSKPE
ncbi:hypothetical protein MIZ03_0959 [Rhodoferax lithotrophicus]|uniref:Uncharacterized protein n=1 Tax=Rhodoferax lithotrophicus TaxID=2798804 RepID=A0ABN6D2D8_9BURK|nr:hypothetical protein MIZ03_0959 [Rhodoferax sp. MIZ03]